MTFKEQLEEIGACEESLAWVGNKTIEEVWETCQNPDWILWILTKTNLDLTDPLCDIVESVLHFVPENHRQGFINIIDATRKRANLSELLDADVFFATCTNNYVAISASHLTRYAFLYSISAFHANSSPCATSVVFYVYSAAYCYSAAYAAFAYDNERKNQCDIFRKYFTIEQVQKAFNKLVA